MQTKTFVAPLCFRLIIAVCLFAGSACAVTIPTSPLTCTVTDSQNNVVSNTCTAPGGNTLTLSGPLGITFDTTNVFGFSAVNPYDASSPSDRNQP
jgi:hypothetical protein